MSAWTFIILLSVIGLGTYFQTVTGFGVGMIVMGVTSGFDLVSVPFIATVLSFVMLVNSAVALHGKLHHIDWRIATAVMVGLIPSSIIGVLLLDYMDAEFSRLLQILLGVVIVYSGAQFAFRPRTLKQISSKTSFVISGFLSGLFGGMFAIPGPPVIFLFYRQPMTIALIRYMLLLVFALMSLVRTVFVMAQGNLDSSTFLVSALGIPVVALATVAGRKFPPPVPAEAMRRIAYTSLVVIGLSLIASAIAM